MARARTLGIVSDTHGLVRPQLLEALAGCEKIVHAGDIGGPEVIAAIERVAPVVAVRGNNDTDAWGRSLAEVETVEFAGLSLCILHDLADLDRAAGRGAFDVIVSGHSHRPRIARDEVGDVAGAGARGGPLYVNPGSAGPRRFRLPVACVRLHVSEGGFEAELVDLLEARA